MTALKKYFEYKYFYLYFWDQFFLLGIVFFSAIFLLPKLLDIVNAVTVNSHFNQSADCGHWVLSCMCLFLISLAGSNKEEEFYI